MVNFMSVGIYSVVSWQSNDPFCISVKDHLAYEDLESTLRRLQHLKKLYKICAIAASALFNTEQMQLL